MRVHPRVPIRYILLILPLLAVVPCMAGAVSPPGSVSEFLVIGGVDTPEIPPLPRCTVDEGVLHDQLRLVFENELLWTRMVAVGVIHDMKGHDVYMKRLAENYQAFQEALIPFYGSDTDKLGALFEEHITLTCCVFHEIFEGVDFTTVLPRWYENGEAIAAYMSMLNPEFWPAKEMSLNWKVYLDDILHGALAFHQEDWTVDVLMLDVYHKDSLAMADYMTTGIVRQCALPQ